MLFDLQSPGRRTAVKITFSVLAVLMASSLLVLSQSGGGGSVLDAFNNDNSGTSDSSIYKKKIEAAERQTTVRPRDAAAWANLARVRYQAVAADDSNFDPSTGVATADGKSALRPVDAAWSRTIALNPQKVDPTTANLMVQALGPGGLNENAKAVTAMEYVLNGRAPSVGLYTQYAELAYAAGQTRKGDLASSKAVALAPKADRATVKSSLAQAKTQATSAATGASGATGSG